MTVHERPPLAPRRDNALSRLFGRLILRSIRWSVRGRFPNEPKLMVTVAPHTSNWDFIIGVGVMFATGLRISYLAKHTLFRPPFGWFFSWLGGIPVDRRASHGVVGEAVDRIDAADKIWFAVAPEGTRGGGEWKSGFFHIARKSGIPVFCVRLDNDERVVNLGPVVNIRPDVDPPEEMARIKGMFGLTAADQAT